MLTGRQFDRFRSEVLIGDQTEQVVNAVQSFAGRNQCNVRVDIGSNSIEIQGTSDEEQRKLVDAFINSVSQ